MSKYVIKFYKEGNIRYTSHLDILRLFKRSFKRVGIKLAHSQGFNPHPKMSFAQPLSLGYESAGEYLEFETVEAHDPAFIQERLNTVMPEGLGVLSCEHMENTGKTLAARTEAASYEIILPGDYAKMDLAGILQAYLAQPEIMVKKLQRKSGKEVILNIKPMIKKLDGIVDHNHIMLYTMLSAGSNENLSPELVLSSFCEFAGILLERSDVKIIRKEIYFID